MDFSTIPVNRKRSIAVARILDRVKGDLELVAGYQGIGRPVFISDINRPGLALSGYLDYFANDRVQLLGNTEIHYMERMSNSELETRLLNMFAFEIPCFVMSRSLTPRPLFLDMCNRWGIPVLRSTRSTDQVISSIILFLNEEFSPETVLHGTVVDVHGVGCLITGDPGVGKSETALELVERGHMLIADDSVEIRQSHEQTLLARRSEIIEHLMEIRGVGIIDVKRLFGMGRVKNYQQIDMMVELEEWDPVSKYDRTGLAEEFVSILDVRIPRLLIPIRPGRNIAIIIEVAALNYRLKEHGINPAEDFNQRLIGLMNNKK